jgi:CheY-like chemotaxis protein
MEINLVMERVAENQSGTAEVPPTILVVDDDVMSQRMMQVLLTREGYKVDTVSNGLEALEAVKLHKYDLVFMDLQMPFMDGVDASKRIREWENGGRHVFIVALTASYFPEEGHKLFEAGIDNYIAKPFDVEHIQRLLKYSLSDRVPPSNARAGQAEALPSDKVLDIQKGIRQMGGDQEMYCQLLSEFVDQLPERLHAIRRSYACKDLAELSRAAHNLNGIAANLGALQLSEYAHRIDKDSVEGYTESIPSLLREMERIGGKLLETSNNFLADKQLNAGPL